MLEIQKWLIDNNFDYSLLERDYGIRANFHPTDNRVILKYSTIDSAHCKYHILVRECRGLVLDRTNGDVIAKAFNRFYHLNEHEDLEFNWNDFTSYEKADGSLILLYHWNGEWHLNTSNSFGLGEVNRSGLSWRELFCKAAQIDFSLLNPYYTYVGELCTPYNHVVVHHSKPIFRLISCFDKDKEIDLDECVKLAKTANLKMVNILDITSQLGAIEYVLQLEEARKTDEGLVLRDSNNNRIKLKNKFYMMLHHHFDNGNLFLVKNMLPIILMGEEDEVLALWPGYEDRVNYIKKELRKLLDSTRSIWRKAYKAKLSQKGFANMVKTHEMSYALFYARNNNMHPVDVAVLQPDILVNKLRHLDKEEL